MLNVALFEPEIPPNAGNVARLCAATATRLHLIGRLGFRMDDRTLRRAGLDYWHAVDMVVHSGWDEFVAAVGDGRIVCVSSKVARRYTELAYRDGDYLLFGSESKGLPATLLERHADHAVTIPMPGGAVRSLNLATAVSVVLYEALRQRHGW
jgi:tRNA (cytidine/uridine-2'-O-)-methyltransferase